MLLKDTNCEVLNTYDLLYHQVITRDGFDMMGREVMELFQHYKKYHRKRIFSLFIESVQNVLKHGLKDDNVQSHFNVLKKKGEEGLLLITGNPVRKEEKNHITRNIDRVNHLSPYYIDKLYYHSLDNIYMSEDGNAGLGIYQIKRKSNYAEIRYMTDDNKNYYYLYLIITYNLT
jgi:hypothetical protein